MVTGPTPNFEALRREIRDYHDAFIEAHVSNRPDFFVQDLSDDYVNVSRGEPTIGLSKDGSVAWSIFRLKVAGTRTLADTTEAQFDSTWGCLVLFERRDGRWVRIAEASNRKPD